MRHTNWNGRVRRNNSRAECEKGLEFAKIGEVLDCGEIAIACKCDALLENPAVGRLFLGD